MRGKRQCKNGLKLAGIAFLGAVLCLCLLSVKFFLIALALALIVVGIILLCR